MITKIQFLWTTSLTLMGYAALELIGAGVMLSFCLLLIAIGWFDSLETPVSENEDTEDRDIVWDDQVKHVGERVTYVKAGHWYSHELDLSNGGSMNIDSVHRTYIERWKTSPGKAIEATKKRASVDNPGNEIHIVGIQEEESGRISPDNWV